jgi:hypothetical protein
MMGDMGDGRLGRAVIANDLKVGLVINEIF